MQPTFSTIRRLILAGCLLALAGSQRATLAHPGHSRSSRLILLDLNAVPPRLSYALIFARTASEAGRKLADKDGDGTVTPQEGGAELDRLTDVLVAHVTVCQGPTASTLACAPPKLSAIQEKLAVGWAPKGPGDTLAFTWTFELDSIDSTRAISVDDNWFMADVDRTDARIEAPQDLRLLFAGQTMQEVNREIVWNADSADQPHKLVVGWEAPASYLTTVLMGLGALVVACCALWVYRSRKRIPPAAAVADPTRMGS